MDFINASISERIEKNICPEGDIFKFIDKECDEFDGFGEIYFSTVKKIILKGGIHTRSSCKIVVVNGEIEFILSKNLTDFNSYKKFLLSEDSLNLLSIPKNTWFAFRGLGKKIFDQLS